MHKLLLTLTFVVTLGSFSWAASAQETLNFYKQELGSFPSQKSRDTRAYAASLASGVDTWVLQNEKETSVQDALLWQARLLFQAQHYGAVMATLFKLRYLYSQADMAQITPLFTDVVKSLDKESRTVASQLLSKGSSADAHTPQAREAEMLYALSKLRGSSFYPAAAQAFERFFARYPEYPDNNAVELWYGDLHRENGNYLAAISQYKKADVLYPNSPYKAASLRLIGDIYADNLKNTAAATEAYTTVLRLYPGSAETGTVYKHMAILDENNKQYDSALINYDKAIELLTDTSSVYEAYRGKADVHIKMKQYAEAYQVLHQAAAMPKLDKAKAVEALDDAGKLATGKLNDPSKYIQSLEKAILLAPADPDTPQRMHTLAKTYEKQGKLNQAMATYKKLILQFPTSKYASRAQKRLLKLEAQAEQTIQ